MRRTFDLSGNDNETTLLVAFKTSETTHGRYFICLPIIMRTEDMVLVADTDR